MKTIIVSGGIIQRDFAVAYIKKEKPDYLIAVDRGMQFCYEAGFFPDYVMGDFDSVSQEVFAYYQKDARAEIVRFSPEKDDTDTEIAVKKAMELGSTSIVLLGALGGRMDHCFANIHVLKLALDKDIEAMIIDQQNYIRLLDRTYVIRKSDLYGIYVSFLPFTDVVNGMTLDGFKYPLKNYTMKKGISIGISNEVVEETATVALTSGILLMIQSKD